MKEKLSPSNRGITLIALIITIIVMLILVGVTITVAVNGGLFEYAAKAGKETNEAITEEKMLAEGKVKIDGFWYDSMDDYLNGIYSENQPNAPIQMTYTLDVTEPARAVNIRITPRHKEYIDYETYGTNILNEIKKTKSGEELKLAYEEMLLEGINYCSVNEIFWSGYEFETLQDVVTWANEDWRH